MFPYPVIIQAFNRPDYLEKVLISLKQQTIPVDASNVWLFLDGFYSEYTFDKVTDAALIDNCREVFSHYFLSSNIFVMPVNQGIAKVRGLIESFAFGTLNSDWALITEDDLELGPLYLEVLLDLKDAFPITGRIASIGAYGEIGYTSRTVTTGDSDNKEDVIDLTYSWATLESKTFWQKRSSILKLYESCFALASYRNRDIRDIQNFFYMLGFSLKFKDCDNKSNSSQDNVRTMLNLVCGGFRLNTRNNFARYIGIEGENYSSLYFEQEGFIEDSALCQQKPKSYQFDKHEVYIFKYLSYHYYYSILSSAKSCAELPSSARLAYGQSSFVSDTIINNTSSATQLCSPTIVEAFSAFRAQCALASFDLSDTSGCIFYVYGHGSRLIEASKTLPLMIDFFWLPDQKFKAIANPKATAPAIVFHIPTIWMSGIYTKQLINNLVYLLENTCRSLVVGSIQGWDPMLLCSASNDRIELRGSLSSKQIKSEYPLSLSEIAQVNSEIHPLLDLDGYDLISVFHAKSRDH